MSVYITDYGVLLSRDCGEMMEGTEFGTNESDHCLAGGWRLRQMVGTPVDTLEELSADLGMLSVLYR